MPDLVLALQKAVSQLLMPTGLLWLGLLVATALSWRSRRARVALAVLAVALTLLGNEWLGAWLLGTLEAPYVGIDPLAAASPYDVVFVLGGGTSITATGRPELGSHGDRVRLAAALYHAGLARQLVVSGSGIRGYSGSRDYGAETRRILEQLAIPADAVSVLTGPRNTSEEIRAYAELLESRGPTRAGLVTSAWHLPRAMALSRRQDLRVDPLPADHRGGVPGPSPVRLVPTARGLFDTTRATWEYLGRLAGR